MEKIKKRKGKGNQSTSFFVFKIVIFILFTIYAITLIYPVIWGFLASLKSHYELMNLNRNGLPKEPSLQGTEGMRPLPGKKT